MPTTDRHERIAIVGVGGIFPGASDLDAFWNNIAAGIDSGRHVPPCRWTLSPEKAFDPEGPKADRIYSTWGCFIEDFHFDPVGLNLDRELLDRLDPLFHLGLHAARAAFHDADQLRSTDFNRVGVILGNIALPTQSTSAMCREVLGRTLIEELIESASRSADHRAQLVARFGDRSPPFRWHPLNRSAASLPAALIAQGLNLGGLAYTLDAACASSLYALKFACEELRAYRADAMLAGGMSRPDCQYTQMGFAQLKALSRRGRCAPLSGAADGLVVGEGAGIFVLKRLSDAIAAGDRIYGVIAGIGLSNDRGANLLAPHSEGQLRAMRSAYDEAGWQPSDVDLIECHATGTPVGDGVEIDSLHQLWEREQWRTGQCVIGGVKSNVGHLLTGAGAAGLMKVLFALKHQTLPPTANYVSPATALNSVSSPFRVLAQAAPWRRRIDSRDGSSIPRRATVNAFGFGGINAHVLIEEYSDDATSTSGHSHSEPASWTSPLTSSSQSGLPPLMVRGLDIAVIGLAVRIGESQPVIDSKSSAADARRTEVGQMANDWGVEQSDWYRDEFSSRIDSGHPTFDPISEVRLPLGEFRIPPLEMQDMLPQQQLMLNVALQALRDSTRGKPRAEDDLQLGNRTGVFIGIELDPNTTNFHLRWSIDEEAPRWAEILGLKLSPSELNEWIDQLKNAIGPALTANRVMGNLGGIVASRLAREFNVGGPSFTISSNANSGLRACELAAHSLRRGELDQALVGAVDLPCDIRNRVALLRAGTQDGRTPICDGATAVVLKRLEDALRDGDQIHAVIRKIETRDLAEKTASGSSPASVGAATGLVSFVRHVASLGERTLREPNRHHWLFNRRDGSRRVEVAGYGDDGKKLVFELSEAAANREDLVSRGTDARVDSFGRDTSSESCPVHLFVVDGNSIDELSAGLERLAAQLDSTRTVGQLAKSWFRSRPPHADRQLAMTFVVRTVDEFSEILRLGTARLRTDASEHCLDRRIQFSAQPLGRKGRVAFVFPGSGNAFLGMGRELLTLFPDVLRGQDAENDRLRDQYRPELIWHGDSTAALLEDHKAMIFGQVALGTAICDLLALFGVRPTASLGYSLGESAALFGLRAWTDRDEMLQRMDDATLFGSDLVRPFNAAKRAWNVPDDMNVDWVSGVIDRSAANIRALLSKPAFATEFSGPSAAKYPRVYLLIINTPTQCVIGGQREDVENLVRDLSAKFTPFSAPSTVHCEILREVEPAYRALHLMRTMQPIGQGKIDFYSTAWGKAYDLNRESAAEAIVAQAVETVDFPQVVEQAYADGVRLFVEIGPGSSCTRMIDEILGDRRHLAQPATPATANPVGAFIELLAVLIAERVPVDLSYLYGIREQHTAVGPTRDIVTRTGRGSFQIPTPPTGWPMPSTHGNGSEKNGDAITRQSVCTTASLQTSADTLKTYDLRGANVMTQMEEMLAARVKAHETYLRVSAEAQRLMAEQLELLTRVPVDAAEPPSIHFPPPRSLSRPQCMEFAIGQIGRVLGQTFAEIDRHPTRVRLPDEPLMLVDRILEIEGEPLSMTSGRVITEHDIHPGAWYLDCDRIPTCIAVEAGQADLFLSGWLGIDFETKGVASYRLLDAVVTFHRELPQPGKTISYDIRINHFFRQGQTYLFRFEFDATVDGQPLLTMREGCAGFFTEAELAQGKGIVHTALDRQPRAGKRPANWVDLVPRAVESYDDSQLLALRHGQLERCFGSAFSGLPVVRPMTLPGLTPREQIPVGEASPTSVRSETLPVTRSKMWLIDRVLKLDPSAGKFGMGTILGELDIHPDDWFLTCHFCDDQVMPGTLMYECCLHTLRIFLLRMGWIGETGKVVYEPIPGIRSRLKCRGQVRANTKKVWYEITLKEIGYSGLENSHAGSQGNAALLTADQSSGTPYCLADALMYADGKPIVEITDMSVRLAGLTRETVEQLWSGQPASGRDAALVTATPRLNLQAAQQSLPTGSRYDRRPALFDTDRITAFAIGNPSHAFGDRYRVFDSERIIARLPGPPFQFLDRIIEISGCEPWVLQAGGQVVAQYDVPPDAWYFSANRQSRMPFAVLLETALQPCGWLAAYVGSALTSDIDLSFRNLGGSATQYREITPQAGTLTTTVKMTRVSNSGGMIIQHYDFDLRCQGEPVYSGDTYFGFFSKASLANQIGIRDAKPFTPSAAEATRAVGFRYIDTSPFADARFQMIDDVQLSLNEGPSGHGFAIGTTRVDPSAWFFKAHFHQDPVVPGSLGLESFFQLLKFYAAYRWQLGADAQFVTPVVQPRSSSIKPKHEWVYRGQVIPRDQTVTVSAVVTRVDDATKELAADGFLSVDGRVIYQMKEFSLGCNPQEPS